MKDINEDRYVRKEVSQLNEYQVKNYGELTYYENDLDKSSS